MNVRGLLVLVVILILVSPSLLLFLSVPSTQYQSGVAGNSVIVIAKEDYVYVRVLITIQPNMGTPVQFTFPNGTSTLIPYGGAYQTETVVLPNTVFYSFSSNSAAGPGYDVSPSHALDISFQNSTAIPVSGALNEEISGIHVFEVLINGSAFVSVQALGVSL